MFAAALCLSACSGTVLSRLAGPANPAPSSSSVDPAFAATLNDAADGTPAGYIRSDGAKLTLTLGAPYTSARGLTCRIGRDDTSQMEYGFCRSGAVWLAVPPRAITGR